MRRFSTTSCRASPLRVLQYHSRTQSVVTLYASTLTLVVVVFNFSLWMSGEAFCFIDILMLNYGAEAFPFTKICRIFSQKTMWKTPSTSELEGLLGCNPFDVLDKINPAGGREEVSISELKEKLVGLYLCAGGNFIPTLHKVYQQCRTRQPEFEIVLVYLPFGDCLDPLVYRVNIDSLLQKISWWRLPFNNSVSRRLWRLISCYPDDGRLVIVGPRGKYVDPYGGDIISSYGIYAYPFTRECLVQRELNKLRALTLESLHCWFMGHKIMFFEVMIGSLWQNSEAGIYFFTLIILIFMMNY